VALEGRNLEDSPVDIVDDRADVEIVRYGGEVVP